MERRMYRAVVQLKTVVQQNEIAKQICVETKKWFPCHLQTRENSKAFPVLSVGTQDQTWSWVRFIHGLGLVRNFHG